MKYKITAEIEDAAGTRTYTQGGLTLAEYEKHRHAIRQAEQTSGNGATITFTQTPEN